MSSILDRIFSYLLAHADVILVGLLTSAIGTGLGAWLAFRLEARERKRVQLERVVVSSNQALAILRRYWSALDRYKTADTDIRDKLPLELGAARLSQIDLSFLFGYGYPKLLTELLDAEDRVLVTAALIVNLNATPELFRGAIPVNVREHKQAARLVDQNLDPSMSHVELSIHALHRALKARLSEKYFQRLIPVDDVGSEAVARRAREHREYLESVSVVREPAVPAQPSETLVDDNLFK